MSMNQNQTPEIHQSRPPRDPNRQQQNKRLDNRGHSQDSNRASLEREVPTHDNNQRDGSRPHYERRSGRPTSSSSAGSQHSVYDEIPNDQVTAKNPNLPRVNNRRPRHDSRRSDTDVDRRPPDHNPVNMRPSGGHSGNSMKHGGSPSRHSQNSASPEMIDLNVSKLSQGSDQSVVTLGGVEYPIGSRIGTTGMFVIGDPGTYPQHDTSSFRSSIPSVVSSTAPIYRGDGKAYSFETWNWTIIRFVIFIFLCIIMAALLAGVIAIAIEHNKSCEAHFEWWKGSTFYNLPVSYFHDSDNSNIGDIIGVEKKLAYFEFAAIGAVILKNFLASEPNRWDLITSFTVIDLRIGKMADFERMLTTLHERNVRVMIHVCPWYTSTEHNWFQQSRESSLASLNKYKDFYVWSDQPDTRQIGDWAYDIVRSQYYLHYADKAKPVLNWRNPQLRDTFNGVLELWLQRGVDGFILCDLNQFYTEDFDFLQKYHATVNSYSIGDDTQRILAVDGDFMAETARLNYPLFEDFVGLSGSRGRSIDMIQTSLYMDDVNRTTALVSQIRRALEWQTVVNGPWIMWDLVRLTEIQVEFVGALQLLDLMLPGTPGYTAGQEIGLFYLESKARYQAPMLWMSDNAMPFNPGSALSANQIYALRNISTARQSVYSLRFDKIIGKESDGLTYNILEVDPIRHFILLDRFYAQDKTYYYAANFGDRAITKDFELDIAPWATVLADTGGRYSGRLELREVKLEPGQAIIFSPTK